MWCHVWNKICFKFAISLQAISRLLTLQSAIRLVLIVQTHVEEKVAMWLFMVEALCYQEHRRRLLLRLKWTHRLVYVKTFTLKYTLIISFPAITENHVAFLLFFLVG